MIERFAACRCGKLRLKAQGEPIRVSVCHCLACQQRTGSVFGVQARFPSNLVDIEGQSEEYVRTADSGDRVRYRFCPACGSTVHYQADAAPDVIAVPIGAFADPDFPPPSVSVYESRKHKWLGLPDFIEHCD